MKTSNRVYHWLVKRQAAWALRALDRNSSTSVRLLASALQKTFSLQMTGQERAWLDRIEQLRSELLKSPDSIVDGGFGPHSPDSTLSDGDLAAGKTTTRKVAVLAGYSSQPFFNAYVQFRLIREFQPSICLELGTSLGLSGAYLATALRCNGQFGQLITLEASAERARLARDHFRRLDLPNVTVVEGRFQDTLPGMLAGHGAFAWASKDAQHTEEATLAFFETISTHLKHPALLVFDDINWSAPMRRAWNKIRSDSRVSISVDLYRTGVCLIDDGISSKRHLRLPVVGVWLPYGAPILSPPARVAPSVRK